MVRATAIAPPPPQAGINLCHRQDRAHDLTSDHQRRFLSGILTRKLPNGWWFGLPGEEYLTPLFDGVFGWRLEHRWPNHPRFLLLSSEWAAARGILPAIDRALHG